MKAIKYILIIVIAIVVIKYWQEQPGKPKAIDKDSDAYKALTKANENVKKAWSVFDASYQRRTDLYNSVIGVIKNSAKFEEKTLLGVMEARANASQIKVDINDSASLAKFQAAQSQLQASFTKLMAVAEAYPDLKSTKAFQDFQTQIEGTENRINITRVDYNQAVSIFNKKLKEAKSDSKDDFSEFKEKGFLQSEPGNEKVPMI